MKNLGTILSIFTFLSVIGGSVAVTEYIINPLKQEVKELQVQSESFYSLPDVATTKLEAVKLELLGDIVNKATSVTNYKLFKNQDEVMDSAKIAKEMYSSDEDVTVLFYSFRVNDVLHKQTVIVREYDGKVIRNHVYFSSNPKYADSSEELEIAKAMSEWKK